MNARGVLAVVVTAFLSAWPLASAGAVDIREITSPLGIKAWLDRKSVV